MKLKNIVFATFGGVALTALALSTGSAQDVRIRNSSISAGAMSYLASFTGSSTGAGGRAQLVRATNETTVVSVTAWGLEADSEYKSHVHALPCALNAGPHYKNDPAGPVDDQNEIWPSFTTDASGVGRAQVVADYSVRPDAMSVVIHDTPNASSGAGAKMLCADLNRTDQGAIATAGHFNPYPDGDPGDATIEGKGSISVSRDGKSIVLAAVSGLNPAEEYRSHVHNLPCDVENGGAHYKIDPDEPGTIESNELWLTIAPDGAGDAYFKGSFDTIARPDAQAIVIHRCEGEGCASKPRVSCATLAKVGSETSMESSGQATSPFTGGYDAYANVEGKAEMVRKQSGTTRVVVRWKGLPRTGGRVTYGSHVHNLPCAVDNGGGHYKLDPSVEGAVESNEMWVGFTSRFGSKTVRKNFRVTPRADAQSVVLHDPDTGARVACADLDYEVGILD